jgi:hypothetical protein
VAKVGSNLAAWPSRTRWAQTIIPARWPDEPRRGGRWLVCRFPSLTSERAVLVEFDARLAPRETLGAAPHGEGLVAARRWRLGAASAASRLAAATEHIRASAALARDACDGRID